MLKLYVREIHNRMVGPQEEGSMKYSWGEQNISISDSIIIYILPTLINKISAWHKVVCGCDFLLSTKGLCSYIYCVDIFTQINLKIKVSILKTQVLIK